MDLALIERHARRRTACTWRRTESRTVEVPRVTSFAVRSLQSTSSLNSAPDPLCQSMSRREAYPDVDERASELSSWERCDRPEVSSTAHGSSNENRTRPGLKGRCVSTSTTVHCRSNGTPERSSAMFARMAWVGM